MKKWKWWGNAGHFIGGNYCRFHLCTEIGEYLISTVGEYFPDSRVRDIIAETKSIKLEGVGDEREYSFIKKIGYVEIGYKRLYETMVFKWNGRCKCGCGLPKISGSELYSEEYNTAEEANKGHWETCIKYCK